MEDLQEELQLLFGTYGLPFSHPVSYVKPKHKPLRLCSFGDCEELIYPTRRLCDTHKAEKAREVQREQKARRKAKAGIRIGVSGTSGSTLGERKPSFEAEISRPHSEHRKPVFGCVECIRRARPNENTTSRSQK